MAVFSKSKAIYKLYLNGREVASGKANESIRPTRLPLRLGMSQDGADRFEGGIERVTLYARALSPEEIGKLAADKSMSSADLPGRVSDWNLTGADLDKPLVSSTEAKLALSRPINVAGAPDGDGNPLTLWYSKPAAQWYEANPIGNGRLGAMVFGRPDLERLQLNDITVWGGGPQLDSDRKDAYLKLPAIRQVIRDGKLAEALKMCNAYMTTPVNYDVSSYQTLGDLMFNFKLPARSVTNYRRQLDLDSAVSTVSFTCGGVTFNRQTFASNPDRAIVQHITASRPRSVSFDVSLSRVVGAQTHFVAPDMLVMTGSTGKNLEYEVVCRVLNTGGAISGAGDRLTIAGADEATLLLTSGTSYIQDYDKQYHGADPHVATANMALASAKTFDTLKASHIAEYQKYFRRVSLDLGESPMAKRPTDERLLAYAANPDPAFAALFYQFGRYLLISCSRPDSPVPANLQGLWGEGLKLPWNCDYTININTEMNYWPAEIAGMSEMHEPLIRHVLDMVKPGMVTAKTYFGPGTPGWVSCAKSNVWGWTSPGSKLSWGMWFGSSGWLCQHLWEHYAFTLDKTYLQSVYPTMKSACEFWLSQLVEGTDGKLITSPSTSPENEFTTDKGVKSSVCEGATMEKAIVWDLFNNTQRACAALGVDADFQKKLEATRDRIRPIQVGHFGQIMEWGGDWDNPKDTHRHVSQLFPLHPGNQINVLTMPELAAAAKKTLELRTDNGTGWSLAWKINFWARLLDGDHAAKLLAMQLRPTTESHVVMAGGGTYPNLFDAHPPFQIDGNFGAVSGITEMLLQSQNGEIYLLPALPKTWVSGSVRGLRARGDFEVDLEWKDGRLETATIQNLSPTPATPRIRYGPKETSLTLDAGAIVKMDSQLSAK